MYDKNQIATEIQDTAQDYMIKNNVGNNANKEIKS